jgi:multidrug transporter EmrE-like cation transporter
MAQDAAFAAVQDAAQLGVRHPLIAAAILGSAAFYVGAMTLMKLWDALPPVAVGLALAICVVAAVWLEIVALRGARLGMVYVAILGAEAVLLMLVARFGFGEVLAPREWLGVGLILGGVAVSAS